MANRMSATDRELIAYGFQYMAKVKADEERDAALNEAKKLERRAFELRSECALAHGGPIYPEHESGGSNEQFMMFASSYESSPGDVHSTGVEPDLGDLVMARRKARRTGQDVDDFTAKVVAKLRADRGKATHTVGGEGDLTDAVMQYRKARRGGVEGSDFTSDVVISMLEQRRDAATGPRRADLTDRVMGLRRARRNGTEYDPRNDAPSARFEEGDLAARSDGSDSFLVGPRYAAQLREIPAATAEQRAKFAEFKRGAAARRERAREDGSPIALTVVGDQARVSVRGMLTEVPDMWAWLLGEPNTLYSDIADAVMAAEQNSSVRHVAFDVESGGGTVSGLRTATKAIRGMKKSRSVLSSFAASAAYWIAAEVGHIEARHDLAEFGSIGVAVRSVKHPIVHDIASTNAPNKRPDPSTEEGKAAIRRELDAIHAVFARDVAAGRSRALGRTITVEQVNSTFGGGGMLLAGEALKRGLIDAIRA